MKNTVVIILVLMMLVVAGCTTAPEKPQRALAAITTYVIAPQDPQDVTDGKVDTSVSLQGEPTEEDVPRTDFEPVPVSHDHSSPIITLQPIHSVGSDEPHLRGGGSSSSGSSHHSHTVTHTPVTLVLGTPFTPPQNTAQQNSPPLINTTPPENTTTNNTTNTTTPGPSSALRILFEDTFAQDGNIKTVDNGSGSITITNGRLVLSPANASSASPPGQSFTAMVIKEADWHNYTLEAMMSTVQQLPSSPQTSDVARLIFHYINPQNYAYFMFKPDGVELGAFQENTQPILLGSQNTPHLDFNTDYNITLVINGSTVVALVNSTFVLNVTDPRLGNGGGIGLAAENAVANFDNIIVRDINNKTYPVPRTQNTEPVEVWWDEVLQCNLNWNINDPYLIAALIKKESWFNETVYNAAERQAYEAYLAGQGPLPWYEQYYGKGLFQITGPWIAGVSAPRYTDAQEWSQEMPSTADYTLAPIITNAYNGTDNINRGCWYAKSLLDLYTGDLNKTISAYHYGWQDINSGIVNPNNNLYLSDVVLYRKEYIDDSQRLTP